MQEAMQVEFIDSPLDGTARVSKIARSQGRDGRVLGGTEGFGGCRFFFFFSSLIRDPK